jgi:hypothetical protein
MGVSAVPHVIHSRRICEFAFASSAGTFLSKTLTIVRHAAASASAVQVGGRRRSGDR